MRWQGRRQSGNVVDRRRIGGRGLAIGGGIGGVGGIVLLVLYLLLGGNPSDITQNLQGGEATSSTEVRELSEKDKEMGEFVSVVLADIEDVWNEQFQRMGEEYREPHLVLYTGQVESACGYGSAAVGPFYCPGDENVYLDLDFFEDMQRELNAPGDFALAYVIAHEVGHHVQNLLGISEQVDAQLARLSEKRANQLTVRMELQADFLAGVWAHYARKSTRISWIRPTSRRGSTPPGRSATTGSCRRRRDTSCRMPSPTAPPNSAFAGSGKGWKPGT